MKPTATPIVRRFGFRNVLTLNGILCGFLIAGCATFSPATQHWLMVGYLLVLGYLQSLQFTAMNAMSFADIPERGMSQAASFSSTTIQLSLSMGVGIAAQLLHLSMSRGNRTIMQADDFWMAFLFFGSCTVLSAFLYLRLSTTAGSTVSGHAADAGSRGS